jgi:hypothetical protein
MDYCMQAQTNQHSSCEINHKELMVSDSKSDWHQACICHCQVAGGSDAINGFAPLEIHSPELFRCKFPHNFLHTKTIQVCQLWPQLSPINIFVGIDASDETFTLLPPFLHMAKKILSEPRAWTGVIFEFVNQMLAVLLVHCARILFLLVQGEYPQITRVTILSSPTNLIKVQRPRPKSSRPDPSGSNC